MRKVPGNWLAVSLVGLVCMSVGYGTKWAVGDVHSAAYRGTKLCRMCHKSKHKAVVAAYDKSAHASAIMAFSPEAVVADCATVPFSKVKIAYVMGSGTRRQAFLDADYKVLPAEWQVAEKKWKAIPEADAKTQCLGCHTTGYDAKTNTYKDLGVGCEMCHGPGGEHPGAQPKETIVRPGTLTPAQQAALCGQCHSSGKDPTGTHAFPIGFRPGDDLARLFKDDKPTEPGYNRQYSELLQSPKHMAAGMVCQTCHDPHGSTDQPSQLLKPVNQLCTDCHGKLTGSHQITSLAAHQPKAAADAKCSDCHMKGGVHTFHK